MRRYGRTANALEEAGWYALGILGALETLASAGTVVVVFDELLHWWDWL